MQKSTREGLELQIVQGRRPTENPSWDQDLTILATPPRGFGIYGCRSQSILLLSGHHTAVVTASVATANHKL